MGLIALPRPEFCIITIERCPPITEPDVVANASPSFADDMYSNESSLIT